MDPQTIEPSRAATSLKARVQAVARDAWENKGRIGCGLLMLVIALQVLRGFLRDWSGDELPASVEADIIRQHENCQEDFPISVTEVRHPSCDLVTIRSVGAGTIPESAHTRGVTRAVCYYMDTENLFWGESGNWKHVMAFTLRTYSKVAVRQDGQWIIYPDEEQSDRARWDEYVCPGDYEFSSKVVPR